MHPAGHVLEGAMEPARGTFYRPDIDGLRAVAVLAVVLFHARTPFVPGGFVGVDVFFVISGYLITGLIVRDIEGDGFSILRFYERRIRRIFPALFLVIGACFACTVVLFLPDQLDDFAAAAIAATTFVSNIWFWKNAGYFQPDSGLQPLLHTWSLSVEEQFYILYPLCLCLLYLVLHQRMLRTVVVALALIASFALSVAFTNSSPIMAFYLLPTRAWELLLGALLVLYPMRAAIHPGVREIVGVAALGMIVAAAVSFDSSTAFPGAAALLPCLGAVLLIHVGTCGGCVVTRLLSMRGAVFVGLVSYSFYLWHWPLIVFVDYLALGSAPVWMRGLAVAVSFVLAVLSWRYVERPFRDARRVSRRQLIGSAIAASFGSLVLGSAILGMNGLPQRFDVKTLELAAGAHDEARPRTCLQRMPDGAWDGLCTLGSDDGTQPSFLLWSDSHGESMRVAISEAAEAVGRAGVFRGSRSTAGSSAVCRAGGIPGHAPGRPM